MSSFDKSGALLGFALTRARVLVRAGTGVYYPPAKAYPALQPPAAPGVGNTKPCGTDAAKSPILPSLISPVGCSAAELRSWFTLPSCSMDVILDREELYRDVWSKGVAMVARKYDLTEGDIRKACFALDVPRPARGYWSKLKTGDAPPVPPLPPSGASTYVCTTVKRKRTPGKEPAAKPAKQKESLVEWVLKNRAEMQTQKSSVQARRQPYGSMHLLPEDMIGLPRFVPLQFWAALLLGEHAPSIGTLLRWVHDGRISPQPIKVGKAWNVRKDAAYIPD